jgi:hypothetical protein
MVKMDQLLCVVTVIQAVCDLCWWRGGIVDDLEVGGPSVIDDANSPEAMSGVSPSAKDDLAIECDFAAGGIEEYFAAGVTEDGMERRLFISPGREWAIRALAGNLLMRRSTACVCHLRVG